MKQTQLLRANIVAFVLVMAYSFLVDGNGEVLGMSQGMSSAAAIVLFGSGFVLAGLMIAKGSGARRVLGVAMGMIYAVMLLPLLLG